MNQKKTSIVVPILWFITTAIWIGVLCVDIYYGDSPVGLTLLRVVCVIASLIAAIMNLMRYKNSKDVNQ